MEVGHQVLHALSIDADEVGDLPRPAADVSLLEGQDQALLIDGHDHQRVDAEAAVVALVEVVMKAHAHDDLAGCDD